MYCLYPNVHSLGSFEHCWPDYRFPFKSGIYKLPSSAYMKSYYLTQGQCVQATSLSVLISVCSVFGFVQARLCSESEHSRMSLLV